MDIEVKIDGETFIVSEVAIEVAEGTETTLLLRITGIIDGAGASVLHAAVKAHPEELESAAWYNAARTDD